jgi:hypothetical protein
MTVHSVMAVLGTATQDCVVTAKVAGDRHKAGHDTNGENRATGIHPTPMMPTTKLRSRIARLAAVICRQTLGCSSIIYR